MTLYTDFYLRADAEADLIAALPMLREFGDDIGTELWIVSGEHHAIDLIGPLMVTPPIPAEDGDSIIEPAVIDERFHVNLRLGAGHPQHADILAAIAPFLVTPSQPRQTWS